MSWTVTGKTVNPPLLDAYSGAAAAYSLRQLQSGSYPVVRVRRSSDNTEADFTAAEVSDGTLASWVGASNNGFVQTWYDQSGNARNATQTTTANQPQIVSSGSLDTDGSKPAIKFNGTSMSMTTAPFGVSFAQPSTIFGLAQPQVFTETKLIVDGIDSTNRHVLAININQQAAIFAGEAIESSVNYGLQRRLLTGLFNTTSSELWQNGSSVATGDVSTALISGFTIGARYNGTGFWDGYMQEIVYYNSNQSTNRSSIESNINAHYSIY